MPKERLFRGWNRQDKHVRVGTRAQATLHRSRAREQGVGDYLSHQEDGAFRHQPGSYAAKLVWSSRRQIINLRIASCAASVVVIVFMLACIAAWTNFWWGSLSKLSQNSTRTTKQEPCRQAGAVAGTGLCSTV